MNLVISQIGVIENRLTFLPYSEIYSIKNASDEGKAPLSDLSSSVLRTQLAMSRSLDALVPRRYQVAESIGSVAISPMVLS